ncbi:MAG: ribonuclease R [Candidatus Gracilibacteria bacterium]
MNNKKIITGKFDKKENFGFLIPLDKKLYNGDFFVALRNSNKAKTGDLVEAVEIINKKGKSSEAKIIKILKQDKEKKIFREEDNKNIIEGVFSQGRGDFGFIDVEGIDKGFFVFSNNKNSALDGDKVRAKVKTFKGKDEAEVIKVLERKIDLIVGEYVPGKNNNFGFVVPNNPNVKNDIFVPGKYSMDAKAGDVVGVLVTAWEKKNPEGVIKQIIGKKGDKAVDVLSLIIEGGGKISFPEKVLSYTEEISKKIDEKEYFKREDLRNLFTFTIDGEDAKDLDDAISVKKLEVGGYKLFVHIADVAHYVTEKSPLDIEAYKRATSTYLVDRVIPMLPEKLSNDLCSLNPNTEKLTLTCEMTIGNNGKITKTKVYESIIKSDYRLTYKEVDEILEQKTQPPSPVKEREFKGEVFSKLQIANSLKEKITKYRQELGVLNFDFPETKIILDEEGNPVGIKEYPKYDSNKLIEEFMISANEAVSRHFSDLPFLYRIHEEPKDDDLAKLQDTLNLFEINFQFKNGTTKEFSILLSKISKLDEAKKMFLEKIILRTLSKAVYSKENFGHFGLGLSFYSHFTSPIRRYPDLQIHRIIKEKITKKLDSKRLSHYSELLDTVSKYTSDKERKAEKLEYRVKDYYIVKYYKNRVGEEFEGVISGIISKGFFVALKDTAEGFVELQRSEFNDQMQEHLELSTGKRYKMGEKVKVRLIEADEVMLRLNFEVI